MAIVFISPKKKQAIFFEIMTGVLVLFLLAVSSIVFLPEIKNRLNYVPPYQELSSLPAVKINFDIIDSDKVKKLEPFSLIETEFSYVAQDQDGKAVAGKVSAISKKDAQKSLESAGLKFIIFQNANASRSDPFTPYYQPTVNTNIPKK